MIIAVRVAEREATFEVIPKTRAKQLFQTLCDSLGIRETWYFGLMYYGPNKEEIWVEQSKKTLKDLQLLQGNSNLHFNVKHYPQDAVKELIELTTVEYFFLLVKSAIVNDRIFCDADTCVLLASYTLQAEYGDYNSHEHDEDTLKKHKLLPERVTKDRTMTMSDWHSDVIKMWKKQNGLNKEQAMIEYLRIVQKLEMYGVSYYHIKTKEENDLVLGITALGINIYKQNNRLKPTTTFPWSEIHNLAFAHQKFKIRLTDKKRKDYSFDTPSLKISKCILNLGMGNHALLMLRKAPDSPEVAKLREEANRVRRIKTFNQVSSLPV